MPYNFQKYKSVLLCLLKVVFIVLALYWIFSKVETDLILNCLNSAKPLWLFVSYLMLNISLFFSALRSKYYFETEACRFGISFSVALYYIGVAFNIILPGGIGGDGYRIFLINKLRKFSKLKALQIILYERINGLYVLIMLTLLLFPFSNFFNHLPHGFELSILLLVITTPCYLYATKIIFRDQVHRMLHASSYSLLVQIFQLVFAACVARAIIAEPNIDDYINYMFLFSVSSIVAVIPISIGGAGLRELTFFYGAGLINVSPEAGVAFAMATFLIYGATSIMGIPLFLIIKKIDKYDRN